MRRIHRFALTLVLVLAGCSANKTDIADREPAAAAVRRQLAYLSDGQYRLAYAELHPAQQALFTADQYVDCGSKATESFELEWIRIIASYKEQLTIPGTNDSVEAVAVVAEMKATGIAEAEMVTTYEILVGDTWRFAASDVQQIVDGICSQAP